jgi:hypothetical protein
VHGYPAGSGGRLPPSPTSLLAAFLDPGTAEMVKKNP